MKIAVTMYSMNRAARAGKMDVSGFIRFCGGLGIQAVDLLEYYWHDKEAEMRAVPGWLRDSGLQLGAFCVGNNFIQQQPEKRAEQIAAVKRGIDTAATLGTRYLRIFGGSLEQDQSGGRSHDPRWGVWSDAAGAFTREQALEVVVECLRPCVQYAQSKNVVLAIENHGGIPGTSDEVLHVIKELNSPHLRALLDFANFLGMAEDPPMAVGKLAPYAVHTHIRDLKKVPRGTADSQVPYRGDYSTIGCGLGDGSVNVRACIRTLQAAGYDGYWSLEFESPMDEEQGVKLYVEQTKAILRDLA
jgi:sugar phosphate isomerase/epimerase